VCLTDTQSRSAEQAMKVVGQKILSRFAQQHADVRIQVNAWLAEALEAGWSTPADIKRRYPSASFLADDQVVFNLKGNNYRLLVKINYGRSIVLIKRIGTHAEYDRWNL
jgi:mRNA interferase HigB